MTAIGIDLGTTHSCVAVYRNGKVEIIANEHGKKTTPSYVAFTNTKRLIGESAWKQAVSNPRNTVYNIKRLIGRRLTDQSVKHDRKTWSFDVFGDDDKPMIWVNYKNVEKIFSPEEISAMILTKMKEVAEKYLNENVTNAVITVPAYFNNRQRQATKDAAKIAGLNLLRMINEPTAASIAFGFDKKVKGELNLLVFDLGGGTLDVSVMCIRNGVYEVKATSGNTHLGGEDFTNRLVAFSIKKFHEMHTKDISKNNTAMKRLRTACENAKCSLSNQLETSIELDYILDDTDFTLSLTRECFEEVNRDLFTSSLEPIKEALRNSQMNESQIDEIVLVGGSTRIPKVQSLIQEHFNGKNLNQSINPDEAVAYGAAVQAAILSHEGSQDVPDILLSDVTPLSLGIALAGDEMDIVIERNTRIPTQQKRNYITTRDNQSRVLIEVYEGEQLLADHSNRLGRFCLDGISPAPRGALDIEVTFRLEVDGILEVSAVEKGTARRSNITIAMERGYLSEEDIGFMSADAERFKADDDKNLERLDARCSLESFALHLGRMLEKFSIEYDSEDDYMTISNALCEVISWLNTNQNADKDEFISRHKLLEETWDLVCKKYEQVFRD